MLQQYADQQAALLAARDAEHERLQTDRANRLRDFEEQERLQKERERLAQEELSRQQALQMQFGQQQQNQGRIAELEREILALRGEYERNQIMLERYDNVRLSSLFLADCTNVDE